MRVLLTVALVAGLSVSSALAAERIGGPRLRPQDARTALVLEVVLKFLDAPLPERCQL